MELVLDNIVLSYSKVGNGKPLILLHGNGEDRHIFDCLVEKLKSNFTVYAIDSRNHGASSKTDDFSYEAMSADILGFINELKLNSPSILGFSDGAIVALMLAISDCQLFEKMILLGVNLKPSDFTDENYAYLVDEFHKTNDPLIKLMLESPNIELDSLKNVTTPTLVVGAENDLFKVGTFEDIVNTMPNAKLKIMNGYEHDSYVVGQDVLYPVLTEFL